MSVHSAASTPNARRAICTQASPQSQFAACALAGVAMSAAAAGGGASVHPSLSSSSSVQMSKPFFRNMATRFFSSRS
eukprot:scaffold2702_cov116-Isochrysis_galbana.AAC.11